MNRMDAIRHKPGKGRPDSWRHLPSMTCLRRCRRLRSWQQAVYTMQDSIAKHTKVLDHLIDGFNLMDQRLKKLESRK
jgi:hypothetical protein